MKALLGTIAFVFVCASCSHAPATNLMPIVKKKAAFELGCSEAELKITELGDQSSSNMAGSSNSKNYGVEGCGKRASYNAYCVKGMMMAENCGANQTSSPVASPAAEPAPTAAP
jgi:hypothetical protein